MACRVASAVLVSLLAACSSSGSSGELLVAVATDLTAPKDIDRITVHVEPKGQKARIERIDLDASSEWPVRVAVPIPSGAEVVGVKASAWQGDKLRIVRELTVTVPRGKRVALPVTLQWLCDGQVAGDAISPEDVASSCGEGLTCVLGVCKSEVVEAEQLVDPGQLAGSADSCFDVPTCFADAQPIALDETCGFSRPAGGRGLNVALALSAGGAGTCDGTRCLIPLDGFRAGEGWTEDRGRVTLPPQLCERRATGAFEVVVATGCATKTISVSACPTAPRGRDAGVRDAASPKSDAGVSSDSSVRLDATVGDTAAPPLCGNGVRDVGELCDGDCPTSCPKVGCQRRKLVNAGTCRASCVDDGEEPTTFYRDADGDTYGLDTMTMEACEAPAGYVARPGDCNDGVSAVRPGATETCNAVDDDCDGEVDDGCPDTEVVSLTDNFASLTAAFYPCKGTFSDVCYSASSRFCRTRNPTLARGGYGPTTVGPAAGAYTVTCINTKNADYIPGRISMLTPFESACAGNNTAPTLPCIVAMHEYCVANGYAGGIGPMEHQLDEVHFLCVKRATIRTQTFTALQAHDAGCMGSGAAFSAGCLAAYHKHCQAAGFASGWGPVATPTATETSFGCLP